MVENIKLLLHGGHEVDAGSIAIFELLVCLGCAGMYLLLGHYSKSMSLRRSKLSFICGSLML